MATPVASAKPWIRRARDGRARSGSAASSSAARRSRVETRPEAEAGSQRLGAGGDADERAGALDLRARRGARPVRGEGLVDRLGMLGLQPGVEQVAHRAGHGAIAVDQVVEAPAQGRLEAGEALGEDVEERRAARRRLARPLQDLAGEGMEASGPSPRPPTVRAGARAPRRDAPAGCATAQDAHRPGQESGVLARLAEERHRAGPQERLGGARPAGDPDLAGERAAAGASNRRSCCGTGEGYQGARLLPASLPQRGDGSRGIRTLVRASALEEEDGASSGVRPSSRNRTSARCFSVLPAVYRSLPQRAGRAVAPALSRSRPSKRACTQLATISPVFSSEGLRPGGWREEAEAGEAFAPAHGSGGRGSSRPCAAPAPRAWPRLTVRCSVREISSRPGKGLW